MTDESDAKPSPPPPCAACGSTVHSTGHHEGGAGHHRPSTPSGRPHGYHDGYPDTLETEHVLENRAHEQS